MIGISLSNSIGNAIPPFSPRNIDDLQLWLDAYDSSTITESSCSVSQWDDKSGKGNDATQGTGSAQPTTDATTQNAKNVLDFDGGDSFVLPSAIYAIANANSTVFMVSKRTTETGSTENLISLEESAGARMFLSYSLAAGAVVYTNNTAGDGVLTITGVTNTDFQILRARRSGTTQALTQNGNAESTNANGADESGVDAALIGANSAGGGLIGSIAEILMYNRSLSTAEISSVETYLSNKWGIAI